MPFITRRKRVLVVSVTRYANSSTARRSQNPGLQKARGMARFANRKSKLPIALLKKRRLPGVLRNRFHFAIG